MQADVAVEVLQDEVTVECLPEELLLQVFALLPPEDLVCRVARVCEDWRRLALDESLWTSAALRYTRDSQDDFVEVVLQAPCLRYLDYSGYTSAMPAAVSAALSGGVRRVRELYLQTTNKIDDSVIAAILLHFKDHLEKLTLFVNSNLVTCSPAAGEGPGAAAAQSQGLEFLSVIGELRALRSLVLKGAWRCHSRHADVGLGCPALRSLDIGGLGTDFVDEHECPFFVMLLHHKRHQLEHIRLNGRYLPPHLLAEVAALRALRSLTTPLATLHVVEHLESLEALHIQGEGHGDSLTATYPEVVSLMLTCPRFGTLKELVLDDVRDYGNAMAPALAAACRGLESLRVTPATWLDPRGLAELIRGLRSLRRLVVSGSTTLRLRHLQVLPRHLPHLQLLDVRGCFGGGGVRPGVLRRLRRGLPHLQVRADPYRSGQRSASDPHPPCFQAAQVAADLSSTDCDSTDQE